jgi:hypothetical protein
MEPTGKSYSCCQFLLPLTLVLWVSSKVQVLLDRAKHLAPKSLMLKKNLRENKAKPGLAAYTQWQNRPTYKRKRCRLTNDMCFISTFHISFSWPVLIKNLQKKVLGSIAKSRLSYYKFITERKSRIPSICVEQYKFENFTGDFIITLIKSYL